MIIRHIPMRSVYRSSFSRLAHYITNTFGKRDRVGKIGITNCISHDIHWASREIEATQAKNTRALGDKSYHLIISFAALDKPSDEVLQAIESRVCGSIGFSEHQRISAIHHDTDNLHIHVAINKIHPKKFTIHEPYKAYKVFADVAMQIEQEYNLQKTNHIARKIGAEHKAFDMEHHIGIESLLGWIQRECLAQLSQAQNWQAFHQILQQHNLVLKERGNGFIILSSQGMAVKASAVSRNLSKSKLEAKFGTFVAHTLNKGVASKIANLKPDIGRIGQKPPKHRQYRLQTLSALDSIQMDSGKYYVQKPLTSRIAIQALYAAYELAQKEVSQHIDTELKLAGLQKKTAIKKALKANQFKRATLKLVKSSPFQKKLLYALMARQLKADILKAQQQYQDTRQKIYTKNQYLTWQDWLNQQKTLGKQDDVQIINNNIHKKQNIHHQPESYDERTTQSRSATRSGVASSGRISRRTRGHAGSKAYARHPQRYVKPNLSRIGRNPPPEARNRLRQLSELGMVQLANGGEMLLQGHVSHYLEYQRTQPNNRLRWNFSKSGVMDDLKKYRHFQPEDAGVLTFHGLHQTKNELLAVLQKKEELIVLSMNADTVNQLKNITPGSTISVTKNGLLKRNTIKR